MQYQSEEYACIIEYQYWLPFALATTCCTALVHLAGIARQFLAMIFNNCPHCAASSSCAALRRVEVRKWRSFAVDVAIAASVSVTGSAAAVSRLCRRWHKTCEASAQRSHLAGERAAKRTAKAKRKLSGETGKVKEERQWEKEMMQTDCRLAITQSWYLVITHNKIKKAKKTKGGSRQRARVCFYSAVHFFCDQVRSSKWNKQRILKQTS